MQVCSRFDRFPSGDHPVTLAIGAFDGIHLGHRAVIAQTHGLAEANGGEAWLLSFDPHPLKVLAPDRCPARIATPDQMLGQLEALELDGLWLAPFDQALADLEPLDFLALLRDSVPNLSGFVVGDNWRFGRQAAGDVNTLKAWCEAEGLRVHLTVLTQWKDAPVSSTRIRQAILDGKMEGAAAMLGRGYSLTGSVVPGAQEGRSLGFPTINLQVDNEIVPPPGIYAGYTKVDGERINGAAYINVPKRAAGIVEMHLLDYEADLYGLELEMTLLKRTREDRAFTNVETLKTQIADDIHDVRTFFG